MISQIRPKLLLLSLVFCIALLPVSQSIATEMGSMETMTEFCPGCDFDKNENTCDVDNSCVSPATSFGSVLIASIQHFRTNSLISRPGDYGEPQFQSQPPGSLYRPPIT